MEETPSVLDLAAKAGAVLLDVRHQVEYLAVILHGTENAKTCSSAPQNTVECGTDCMPTKERHASGRKCPSAVCDGCELHLQLQSQMPQQKKILSVQHTCRSSPPVLPHCSGPSYSSYSLPAPSGANKKSFPRGAPVQFLAG